MRKTVNVRYLDDVSDYQNGKTITCMNFMGEDGKRYYYTYPGNHNRFADAISSGFQSAVTFTPIECRNGRIRMSRPKVIDKK